uniref:BACK domain-containing protein n=1 Tax=Parascaris univalens TaxID=6257 RepID=A0A915ARB3_PARUN
MNSTVSNPVIFLATQYKIRNLRAACVSKIRNMSPDECISILQQAVQFEEIIIIERCLKVADANTENVLRSESLLDSDSDVLEVLIRRDTFIPSSELRLFMALFSWSIAKCQRAGLDLNAENEKRFLQPLLNLVNFKALSKGELADVVRTGVITDHDIASLSERCSRKSTDNILSVLRGTKNEHQAMFSAFKGKGKPKPRFVKDETSTTTEKTQNMSPASVTTLKFTPSIAPQSPTSDGDSTAKHSALLDSSTILSTGENQPAASCTPVSRFSRITAKIRNSVRRISASFSSPLSSPPSSPSPLSSKNIEMDVAMASLQEKPSPVNASMFTSSVPSASSPFRPTLVPNSSRDAATPVSSLLQEESLPEIPQHDAPSATSNTPVMTSVHCKQQVGTVASEAAATLGSIPTIMPSENVQANARPVKRPSTTRPVGMAARIVQLNGTKPNNNISQASAILRKKNEHFRGSGSKNAAGEKNEVTGTSLQSSLLFPTTKSTPELAEITYSSVKHPSVFPRVSSADMLDSKPKSISRLFSSPSDMGTTKTNKLSEKLSKIVHRSRVLTRHDSEPKRERPGSASFLVSLKEKFSFSHSLQKKPYSGHEDHTLIAIPTETIRAHSSLQSKELAVIDRGDSLQQISKTRPLSKTTGITAEPNISKGPSGEEWFSEVQKDGKHASEETIQMGSQVMPNSGEDAAASENAQQAQISRHDTYPMTSQNVAHRVETKEGQCEVAQKNQITDLSDYEATVSGLDGTVMGSDAFIGRLSREGMSHTTSKGSILVSPASFATSNILVDAKKDLQGSNNNAKELTNNTADEQSHTPSQIPVAAPRRKVKSVKKNTTSSKQPLTKESLQTPPEIPFRSSTHITDTMNTLPSSVSTHIRSSELESFQQSTVATSDLPFNERGRSSFVDSTKSRLEAAFSQTKKSPDATSATKSSLSAKGGVRGGNDHGDASAASKARLRRNEEAEVVAKRKVTDGDLNLKRVDKLMTTQQQTGAERVPTIIVDADVKGLDEPGATESRTRTDSVKEPKQISPDGNEPTQVRTEIKRKWSSLQKKPLETQEEPVKETKLINNLESWHRSEPSVSPSHIESTVHHSAAKEDSEANGKSNAFKSGLISMRCSKPAPEPDRFDEQNKLARKQALLSELERLHASVSNSDHGSTISKLSASSEEGRGAFGAESPLPLIAKAELLAASRGAFTPHIGSDSTLFPLKRSIDGRRSFNVKSKKADQSSSAGGFASGRRQQLGELPSVKVIKQSLLKWCQHCLKDYPVKVWNFSSCWADGMAFCALAHRFASPSTRFDFEKLNPQNRRDNLTLAFSVAEKNGVVPLLEVDDMLEMGDEPDWKCVFVYVQSFYRQFKDRL